MGLWIGLNWDWQNEDHQNLWLELGFALQCYGWNCSGLWLGPGLNVPGFDNELQNSAYIKVTIEMYISCTEAESSVLLLYC